MARRSRHSRYYGPHTTVTSTKVSHHGRDFARRYDAWGPLGELVPYEDLSDRGRALESDRRNLRAPGVSRCKVCRYGIPQQSLMVPPGYHRHCYEKRMRPLDIIPPAESGRDDIPLEQQIAELFDI